MLKDVRNMINDLHQPPHLAVDSSWRFITAHTLGNENILKNERVKEIWISKLHILSKEHNARLKAYVILDDHYHILCRFKYSNQISKFINHLHGGTSREINLLDSCPQRKIWQKYCDKEIRDEDEFWTRFNYIHYNPVKHGYVRHPEDWKHSSYKYYIGLKGEEWLNDCWESYPAIKFNFEN